MEAWVVLRARSKQQAVFQLWRLQVEWQDDNLVRALAE
jgi:hypothetical protein